MINKCPSCLSEIIQTRKVALKARGLIGTIGGSVGGAAGSLLGGEIGVTGWCPTRRNRR